MPVVPPGQSHTRDVMDLLQGKLPPAWHVEGNSTGTEAMAQQQKSSHRNVLLNSTKEAEEGSQLLTNSTMLRQDVPSTAASAERLTLSSVVILSSVGIMCFLLFLLGFALLLGLPPVLGEAKMPSLEWPFSFHACLSKRKVPMPPASKGELSPATCYWIIAVGDWISSLAAFPSVLWLAWLLMLATSIPIPEDTTADRAAKRAESAHDTTVTVHSLRRLGMMGGTGGQGALTVGVVLGVTGILTALVAFSVFGFVARMRQKSLWPLTGLALLVPPPAVLRALGMHLAATRDGASYVCGLMVVVGTLLLEALKMSATGVLKIQLVKSRWRVVVWGSVTLAIGGVCEAVSPYLSALSTCVIAFADDNSYQLPFNGGGTVQSFFPREICSWSPALSGLVVRSPTTMTDPQMLAAVTLSGTIGPACIAYVVQLIAWRSH